MTTLSSLIVIAAVAVALAGVVAWLRGLAPRDAGADTLSAVLAALGALVIAVLLFALSRPLEAPLLLRNAASLALMASPLAATLALRLRGRRSVPRALFVSALALSALLLWLTLRLKGVRGGWTAAEVVIAVLVAAIAVAFAACLGWWSKRARGRAVPS